MFASSATCLLNIGLLHGCYEGIAADVICCPCQYIGYLKASPVRNVAVQYYFLLDQLAKQYLSNIVP